MRLPLYFYASFAFVAFGVRADDVTFKTDVALSRVDAQVLDRDGRTVTGLTVRDFLLRVDGKVQPIKNFDSESMPIDILLLLDVSGSMRPHVQRIASAAQQALNVLTDQDRLAVMVFDTRARERLAFTNNRADVSRELQHIVRSEGFNGGTRITSSLIEAASYLGHHARAEARHAVVILTDDETQDAEDEPRVEKALSNVGAVLSFLRAPYEANPGFGRGGGRRGPIGLGGGGPTWSPSGWPGGGGGPSLGGGSPGGGDRSHSAGTDTIAGDSGGDTMPVTDASALEETLARLRQRYALHFYMPEEAQTASRHSVRVDLTEQARILHPNAQVLSHRVFMSGASSNDTNGPVVVTQQTTPPVQERSYDEPTVRRRRVAVNEDSSGSTAGPTGDAADESTTPKETPKGWPRVDPNSNKPQVP